MTKQVCRRERAINVHIACGALRYRRKIHLPRLIPVPHSDLDTLDQHHMREIVSQLHCALRRERTRGKQGHWAYDLNRHMALMAAYKQELKILGGTIKDAPS